MSATITAAIIARDEEQQLPGCLEALRWADETLVVVDARSTDRTAAIAEQAGARVLLRTFDTFARQRNYALAQATGEWVFFVDADERVSPELADELRATVAAAVGDAPDSPAGYWAPRQNIILGQWVQHAGWWPDYQLRLLQRGRTRYDESQDPHEVVLADGPTARLSQPLVHYNYSSVGQLFSKQLAYAPREARSLRERGVRALPHKFVTRPLWELYYRYFQLQGYKEGPLGLLLALVMAWYQIQVYVHLRRLG